MTSDCYNDKPKSHYNLTAPGVMTNYFTASLAVATAIKITAFVCVVLVIASLGVTDAAATFSQDDIYDGANSQHGILPVALAQNSDLDMNLEVTDDEKIAIFAGFSMAVIGIFLFLARDIILRKKTDYDSDEYASKKERTYEKYHSEWTDDYEEVGTRKRSKPVKDLFDDINDDGDRLPDYYRILEIDSNATQSEIKKAYRRLAKESHPDRARQNSSKNIHDNANNEEEPDPDSIMAKINKAYEVLSDEDLKRKYDAYMGKKLDT